MSPDRRIAVVGMGGVFPGAADLEEFWRNVLAGTSSIAEVPAGRWPLSFEDLYAPDPAPDRVYSTRAGLLPADFPYDLDGLLVGRDLLSRLDPLFSVLLHAGRRAWDDAGLRDPARERCGVIIGNIVLPTVGSAALTEEILGPLYESKVIGSRGRAPKRRADRLDRYAAGLPAGLLSRALDLRGGAFTLDAACASSLYALKLAGDELLSGRADIMLSGGLSRPDSLYTQSGFSQLRALSRRGVCSPFDAKADGLVVGEGAGIVVLRRLEDALREGNRIYGVIAAAGLSNDRGGSIMAPDSEGQLRAMTAAYEAGGWAVDDVDLVECHGTGTPVGDTVEFASLSALWREAGGSRERRCVIGSVKSNVGHLLTAAGAAGLIKTLLALRDARLPPTANFEAPPRSIDLDGSPFSVLRESRDWPQPPSGRPRRAAVSAFGFGGTNAHVLVEEWRGGEGKPAARRAAGRASSAGPVAIVGMDARFGPWESLEPFAERVLGGGEEPGPSPPERAFGIPGARSLLLHGIGEMAVPLGRFPIPPTELEEMLPQQLLMLQVAANAFDDAGVLPEAGEDKLRTGVFIGLGLDLDTTNFRFRWELAAKARRWAASLGLEQRGAVFDSWVRGLRDAASPPLTANRTMGALGSIAASRVARAFRVGGVGYTISSEETSGMHALETAMRALRQGDLDTALVGAVDIAGDGRSMIVQHECRGSTVFGEGACALVLKRLDDALRDGNHVYAVISGAGRAHEGAGGGGDAFALALARACADGAVDQAEVSLFETSSHPRGGAGEVGTAFERLTSGRTEGPPCAASSAGADIGDCGAASALASVARAALCLHRRRLPPSRGESPAGRRAWSPGSPLYWLRDRADGPRRAAVASWSVDGNCGLLLLEEASPERPTASLSRESGEPSLLAFEGDGVEEIGRKLTGFGRRLAGGVESVESLALARLEEDPLDPSKRLALAVSASSREELRSRLSAAAALLAAPPKPPPKGVFFSPDPLGAGAAGKVAFVYPGSGMNFPGMGRELALRFPRVIDRLDGENLHLAGQFADGRFWSRHGEDALGHVDEIFGQVWLGTLVSDVVSSFGIAPGAVVGYSLGETAGLFSTRAWTARDEMRERMLSGTLFTRDLAGPCLAARKVWGLGPGERVDWQVGVAGAPAAAVREAIAPFDRLYLLIVNTPDECVIGGDRRQLEAAVRELGCAFVPLRGVTTVHCPAAAPVREAYRELHLFPTTPPGGVRFYSCHLGRAYEVSTESCADSIVGQALEAFDYGRLVERVHGDGVRIFLEMGPGASCTRMIDRILAGRPHLALSACRQGESAVDSVTAMVGRLLAERVPLRLDGLTAGTGTAPEISPREGSPGRGAGGFLRVPLGHPPFAPPGPPCRPAPSPAAAPGALATAGRSAGEDLALGALRCEEAAGAAQGEYLLFAREAAESLEAGIALQRLLLGAPSPALRPPPVGGSSPAGGVASPRAAPRFDREQCMEFAVGSIAKVLGGRFAEVDSFPTRVRLPDEPLMLVDRIVEVEGEPASMTRGRVVTEHDILAGAWYLDHSRIPTCIAVEAGQADLFLSAYLGIDLHTRGRAVYRLLDASIVFHRGLPGPGSTIRYDIAIDGFFSQGGTRLFRFRFEATVDGEPLLSMRNGVAGFFTQEELDAGRGLVLSAMETAADPRELPADWEQFVPMGRESYGDEQLRALTRGDLAACFGEAFAGLGLRRPPGLPSGRMTLVHRIVDLDPRGGRYGLGEIVGEADIDAGDWFLTCHFSDDHVMPGTLMYECCLHTLRVFLLRLGWVGEADGFVYEPVPGETSSLRCRGQVIETSRKVRYRITIKELGYRGASLTPHVLADALMYIDGRPSIQMAGMSLRLEGLTRHGISRLWAERRPPIDDGAPRPPLFDEESIRQFTEGKPSLAFGKRYEVFDAGRVIARLPRAPYRFLDRVVEISGCEQWKLAPGGEIVAQYDVPASAWYFAGNGQRRHPDMPFAVLLEAALQPCGWLAAYVGSALASDRDLAFRNLGGTAVRHRRAGPGEGTVSVAVRMTGLSRSAGMIIQHFDTRVSGAGGAIYSGSTTFGFFSREALARQVGIRDASPHVPGGGERARAESFAYPEGDPFPGDMLRMIDRVEHFDPRGGPAGLGFIEGSLDVRPAWFYEAHFYQDPVTPGSLGLESLLQLLRVVALRRWPPPEGAGVHFEETAFGETHSWLYRGQVVQSDRLVRVQASVKKVDDGRRTLWADGWLSVDGRVIYKMVDFSLTFKV